MHQNSYNVIRIRALDAWSLASVRRRHEWSEDEVFPGLPCFSFVCLFGLHSVQYTKAHFSSLFHVHVLY